MLEREKKFLVNPDKSDQLWKELQECTPEIINQGYLMIGLKEHLRVRTIQKGNEKKGYICYKSFISKTDRDEFEYEIPFEAAEEMIKKSKCSLTKSRYKLPDYSSDVDVYVGGLVIVEIEFTEKKLKRIPYFCGEEVTSVSEYSNIHLAKTLKSD